MEIMKLKGKITEMKNSPGQYNSILEQTDESMNLKTG